MSQVYPDRSDKAEPVSAGIAEGNRVTDLMSVGWTDERHMLYISSMENYFIDQLYNHGHYGNQKGSSGNGFKVLQGGVWKKLNFERTNACAQVGGKRHLPANPWIQRFMPPDYNSSVRGDGVEISVGDRESGIRTIPGRTPLSHGRELGGCKRENIHDEEVFDQNFADDEVEVDAKSSKAWKKRRLSSTSTYCA